MKTLGVALSATALMLAAIGAKPAWDLRERVVLDRLKWSPDGSHLAVEARYEASGLAFLDTLLIDLSRGQVRERCPKPAAFALDRSGQRFAAATRHVLYVGHPDRPEEALPSSRRNPTAGAILKLSFTAGGDSLAVMSRPRSGSWYEITAYSLPGGREALLSRVTTEKEAMRQWAARAAGSEPLTVEPTPFPHMYLPLDGGILFTERTTLEIPGVSGVWLFDLKFRNAKERTETALLRAAAPYAHLVSPDSSWVAIAGVVGRPDYGGNLLASLWILSGDGRTFYSVHPEGIRSDVATEVSSMVWSSGDLWYLASGDLYRLSPSAGRSQRVSIGEPAPAWSDSLGPSAAVSACLLRTLHEDSTQAVRVRDELRRAGLPAWIEGRIPGPYRVAVGSESNAQKLEPLALSLGRLGYGNFEVATFSSPIDIGNPFPSGVVRCPQGIREAYVTGIGPPGFLAAELWISEKRGERQVRLLRGALNVPSR